MKSIPQITTLNSTIFATGLMTRTGMKSVFKDLPVIYRKFMDYQKQYPIRNKKEPWEYVSLSRNFTDDKAWDYLTGYVVREAGQKPEVYTDFEIPPGKYAVFQIRPKLKFLLGLAMIRTKRYIYGKWMEESGYVFNGFEFEYNNESMSQENPSNIDLYVGLKNQE